MNKIPFENGKLVTPAKLNEDNTITPAKYIGTTPLSAHNLNLMQDNIENEIADLKINNFSNEYGNVIKFPDGTLIQYGSYNLGTINAHSGNYHTLVLPMPFVDTNYVATVTKMSGGSAGFAAVSDSIYRTSNSKIDFIHWNDADILADSFLVGWVAIGKWK